MSYVRMLEIVFKPIESALIEVKLGIYSEYIRMCQTTTLLTILQIYDIL
jgi:hypothetical protein